jgi:hypothetical protein
VRLLQHAWARLLIISESYGDYAARFTSFVFYFTILVPFALITRFAVDPMHLKKSNKAHWLDRKAVGASLEEARSQS